MDVQARVEVVVERHIIHLHSEVEKTYEIQGNGLAHDLARPAQNPGKRYTECTNSKHLPHDRMPLAEAEETVSDRCKCLRR